MPRAKFQTLTEQMFYILLCLREECCGMDILDKVPAMTQGRVSVGSGTLYNLLEQFCGEGMIRETKVEGRKRSYILMPKGRGCWKRSMGASGPRRRTTAAGWERSDTDERDQTQDGDLFLLRPHRDGAAFGGDGGTGVAAGKDRPVFLDLSED